jgi:hypothetical protein
LVTPTPSLASPFAASFRWRHTKAAAIDGFDEFSEVERMSERNRETAFVAKPRPAPLTEDQRMLDDPNMTELKIERS